MTQRFRWDHGQNVCTYMWRHEVVLRAFPRLVEHVWRDSPPGEEYELELAEEDGRPVDDFGLPVQGTFVDVSVK